MEREKVHVGVGLGILKRENWEDLGIAEWIILQWPFKNRIGRACRLD